MHGQPATSSPLRMLLPTRDAIAALPTDAIFTTGFESTNRTSAQTPAHICAPPADAPVLL